MLQKFVVIMTVASSIASTASASPSPHHHDDEYRQYYRLLKEARKQQKRNQYAANFNQAGSSQNSQIQYPDFIVGGQASSGASSVSGGSTAILTPGNNRRPIDLGSIPPAGGSSSNYGPIFPTVPSGSQIVGQLGLRPPYPIEQVNRGVSTILNGVRSLDLGQILRGAFIFPRNENVRSVANNVIDSIFGAQRTTPRK